MTRTRLNSLFRLPSLLLCTAALSLAACSEADDTVEEYPEWQQKNETWYAQLSDSVATLLQNNPSRTDWKRVRSYSKTEASTAATDYVIIHLEQCGHAEGTASPLLTDTVSMHYSGHLLPSTSYAKGLQFDASYRGDFDIQTAAPTTFAVSGMVDGMATALQHLHAGDRATIYMPYQLGYGTTTSSTIPAYSTLIFDVRLVRFWSPKASE